MFSTNIMRGYHQKMISKTIPCIFLLLVTPQMTCSVPSTDDCDPNCSGQPAGASVPDPRNCHRYYTCLQDERPSDMTFTCPNGGKFDMLTSTCSQDLGNVTCATCQPRCSLECPPGAPSFVASRYNCSEYILCGMGQQDPVQCPIGVPYYDGAKCQDDITRCCEPCQVYCHVAFTEVADPTNCRNFYLCVEHGYFPGPEDLYRCPDEDVFWDGECHSKGSVECEQPCSGD